jgi:hypothetical protein
VPGGGLVQDLAKEIPLLDPIIVEEADPGG